MGALGANLIAPGSGVLTHCNTGSLATAGLGTALGVALRRAARRSKASAWSWSAAAWPAGSSAA